MTIQSVDVERHGSFRVVEQRGKRGYFCEVALAVACDSELDVPIALVIEAAAAAAERWEAAIGFGVAYAMESMPVSGRGATD